MTEENYSQIELVEHVTSSKMVFAEDRELNFKYEGGEETPLRNEEEHARLVKQRIDELGLDSNDENRKRIVAEPNFTGTESCAFYC